MARGGERDEGSTVKGGKAAIHAQHIEESSSHSVAQRELEEFRRGGDGERNVDFVQLFANHSHRFVHKRAQQFEGQDVDQEDHPADWDLTNHILHHK